MKANLMRQTRAKEVPIHGFLIRFDDDDGLQPYFKKKLPRRLIFTYSLESARKFKTEAAAQKYMNTLLAVSNGAKFSIEEYNAPELAKKEIVAE